MFCISLNHDRADLAQREAASLDARMVDELSEGVFLSTCNRVEVYGVGDLYRFLERHFRPYMSEVSLYEGRSAMRHLYRVAAGLDSMVLGEDEILGQVKRAYEKALADGRTGYELNTVFQGALTAAKRIKTETLLSKTSVSTATLAASACMQFWRERAAGRNANVLMIGGSGEIGTKFLKDLLSYGCFDISATVREHSVRNDVLAIDYNDRYLALRNADIVVSATKSPHFTVTEEKVRALDKGAARERLYVDLAVPRDIDPALAPILTIDDLKDLARENNEKKQTAAAEADDILHEELETLYKDLTLHTLREDGLLNEQTFRAPWNRFLFAFRDAATAAEFDAFSDVLHKMNDEETNA